MKSPARFLRNIAAPTTDSLYKRAMKDEKTYSELADGTEIVPIFNPVCRVNEIGPIQSLVDKYGNAFGTKQVYEAETDFGIDYAAASYQPLGGSAHGFYIDIDVPVCTGINGLNDEVAIRLTEELGVGVILKGPEFSAMRKIGLRRLASVALASTNISQSFSAENSMAISAEIVEREGLPRKAVVYGKSRGAMIGGKKYPYAIDRDINIVHYRLIDPCIGQRAFENPADVLRFATWPASDMIQSIPSFAKFALEGKLRSRARTLEVSPAYLAGMVLGTVPSLLSGESMGNRIPLNKGVSVMHMAGNPIADIDEYMQQFAQHANFDHHQIPDNHIGGIVLPRNIRRSVRHLRDFGEEFEVAQGDEARINWVRVHNNPKKASVTHIHAA